MRLKILISSLVVLCAIVASGQPTSQDPLLQKGWSELVKDNDTEAFRLFWQALEKAKQDNNEADKAEAYLYLGICSFGSSLEKGLQYATQSIDAYHALEASDPEKAKIGRSKCLQLVSTIYLRQGKTDDAKRMSREVIETLKDENDRSGTLGLAYATLGSLYLSDKKRDSAAVYFRLSLTNFQKSNNYAYLPGAYLKTGELENKPELFLKSLAIADSTENKQAQVSALLTLGKWQLEKGQQPAAEAYFDKANDIAKRLTDKVFEVRSLEALIDLKTKQRNFEEASRLQARLIGIKDEFYSLEREQIVKNLEVQFEVSEKNRKLALMEKEGEVSKLTNIILVISIIVLLIVFISGYFFLKSINRRDKQLLKTKEALVAALEQQKTMEEQQFRNDLEHKESQLSAITLQMLQKNELIDEIKQYVQKDQVISGRELLKMVNKHLVQDNSWNDFDLYFEGINKNFYTRLKSNYPDISNNDLKICALIKLNLSIKEMASILNISPDSVKTARYRLRKKLQLHTEDNLTDFILSI
ncbi:HTH luxR-type domain-containing protein [Flavobacterium longum]|uniref:tetratricopeptide repeat protein n=1 Tax=Flavobacterium longum TaxID=1299340 RepID=UPI0039EAD361